MTMKICIIGPTYPYRGGISHYNTLLCENLKKRHDIKSISFKRLYPSFLYPGKDQKDLNSKIIFKTDRVVCTEFIFMLDANVTGTRVVSLLAGLEGLENFLFQ